MSALDLKAFEKKFESRVAESIRDIKDPGHDITHYQRVVRTAKKLARKEGARAEVVVPAAWLHDLVPIAKTDPRRT
ncbi:MAG TPA: hypothetical protein VM432_06515, partial [Bdellovibrionales bacterium]|nr:hypothetical protein [Bdellovibrionales bacterium]